MAEFRAVNIRIVAFDRAVDLSLPQGNRFTNLGFTCDIHKDGVKIQEYNEPDDIRQRGSGFSVPDGATDQAALDLFKAHAERIIKSKLRVIASSNLIDRTTGLTMPDIVSGFVPPPPPPTQDEIDRAAFVALCQTWTAVFTALAAAARTGFATRYTQRDLDEARAAVNTAYRDEYANLLPTGF